MQKNSNSNFVLALGWQSLQQRIEKLGTAWTPRLCQATVVSNSQKSVLLIIILSRASQKNCLPNQMSRRVMKTYIRPQLVG